MPLLDICPKDFVEPIARQIMLAYIEGVMLWPDDVVMRRRLMSASGVEWQRRSLLQQPPEGRIGLSAEDYVALIDAPRIADLQEAYKPIFGVGVLVGHVLAEIVGRAERGSPLATLSRVRTDVARHFSRKKEVYRVSDKSVEKAWARLRSTSHLWAAYTVRSVLQADLAFPSRAQCLESFLAVAEAYRRAGERYRPAGAKAPILDCEHMWRVPEELLLPEASLPEFRLGRIKRIDRVDYLSSLQVP